MRSHTLTHKQDALSDASGITQQRVSHAVHQSSPSRLRRHPPAAAVMDKGCTGAPRLPLRASAEECLDSATTRLYINLFGRVYPSLKWAVKWSKSAWAFRDRIPCIFFFSAPPGHLTFSNRTAWTPFSLPPLLLSGHAASTRVATEDETHSSIPLSPPPPPHPPPRPAFTHHDKLKMEEMCFS